MNPEVMERLLIDRGMGELSDDVNALLRAYVDARPREARRAEEIDETILLARRALRTTVAERSATPPPFAGAYRSYRRRATRWAWTRRLATAAMIALAFWLGSLGTRPSPHAGPVALHNALPAPTTRDGGTAGFWSTARLRQSITGRPPTAHPHAPWPGPLTRPPIGGAS